MNYTLFFQLLQVAACNRTELSTVPTAAQWEEVYRISRKHTMVGVIYGVIQSLKTPSDRFAAGLGLNKECYKAFLSAAVAVDEKNRSLSQSCRELCEILDKDGLECLILKGQGNLQYYPDYLKTLRAPGDIDVYCRKNDNHNPRAVIDYVLAKYKDSGILPLPEVNYHHTNLPDFHGAHIEVHYRAIHLENPVLNHRLQQWLSKKEQWEKIDYDGYPTPTLEFNAVYQMIHIFHHLLFEGVGFRQLLDYCFVLRALQAAHDTDYKEVVEKVSATVRSFGLEKFAGALMWVLQQVFDLPQDLLVCVPDKRRGEFMLKEILIGGNFGRGDKRNAHSADENLLKRFIRRQKRRFCFFRQYPRHVLWGPFFSTYQRMWRVVHGWN